MKTTKLFFMAALALMTAACSNDDNDLTTQQPQKAEGITITAQLAPKTSGATTRAVSDGTDKIVAEWAVDEHIAVLYTKDATPYAADATITAVDGSGAATIEFTVEAGTPNNTACTLVYPYDAAKDDHTGVKDAATLLAAQNGTLNANLDVRVGEGTIQTTTPGLTVTTQPAAQFAIFKFTTKNSGGTATIDVNSLTVTIGSDNYVITPASATSELYVALPAVSDQTVSFTATGSDSKTYNCSKASVNFAAGKYYQSTLRMVTLAETMTTAGMTVKVNYNYDDEENYCLFVSNGDGTYTFQSGDGYAGGDADCAKALVVEDGKLVFKQNFYETIDDLWEDYGFSVTFDTSNNTYSEWAGENAKDQFNPSFISVEVNGTTISLN